MLDVATSPGPAEGGPSPVEPFPPGSRILHIGPPKTGTTALQVACQHARHALLDQGVRFAGTERHATAAAIAVTGHPVLGEGERRGPSMRPWQALVAEIRQAREPRVLYSSEWLAMAGEDAIRRIASDVGPDIGVLITLRPIDAILASQWQQEIQHGSELELDDWLRRVLDPQAGRVANGGVYRRPFHHGDLVERWAAVVGPGRVTVVVLDRADPGFMYRTVEALLALRPGTLQAQEDRANRSLTLPEVEVIRRMNAQARAAGLDDGARSRLVTWGAAAAVKRGPARDGAPRVRLPAWAAARAVEMGEAAYAAITASGVRVLGDPLSLVPTVRGAGDDPGGSDEPVPVDAETAATLALGVAWGTGLRLGSNQPVRPPRIALTFVPTRVLVRQVMRRGLAWVGRSWKAVGIGRH